jgi:hypothetical protein
MNDRATVAAGALGGAVLGAATTYLLLTGRGRHALSEVQPALHDVARALGDLCMTIDRLGAAVREGRRVSREIRSAS